MMNSRLFTRSPRQGREQLVRDGEAEHPGRLSVDHQLELGRLYDRQIRDLRAFEDAASVDASLMEGVVDVGSVAHQSARLDIVARRKRRRNPMTCRQRGNLCASARKKGSGVTNSASGRWLASVVNAVLISPTVPVLKTWICRSIVRPADSASLTRNSARAGLAGLTKTATWVNAGTSSRRSSSRFGTNSPKKKLTPVRLAPGRERLATSPRLTGSSGIAKTIGIVVVAALAAIAGAVPPFAKMTVTRLRTRSAASAGNRASWFSAHPYSIPTLSPSTKPASLRPCRNARTRSVKPSGDTAPRNPI